jgi:hypothetical protein
MTSNIIVLIKSGYTMEGMSECEYSTHSGTSLGAIQKARKAGRLVVYGDGSINAAASEVRRPEITDPDQQRRSTGGDFRFSGRANSSSYFGYQKTVFAPMPCSSQIAFGIF